MLLGNNLKHYKVKSEMWTQAWETKISRALMVAHVAPLMRMQSNQGGDIKQQRHCCCRRCCCCQHLWWADELTPPLSSLEKKKIKTVSLSSSPLIGFECCSWFETAYNSKGIIELLSQTLGLQSLNILEECVHFHVHMLILLPGPWEVSRTHRIKLSWSLG